MRLSPFWLCLGLFCVGAPPSPASAEVSQAHPSRYYGAIDLGSRGIKASLFHFVQEAEGPDASVIYKNEVLTRLVSSAKDGSFTAAGIEEAAQATATLLTEMRAEATKRALPAVEYYIVGSSGVARFANRDELKRAVDHATGLDMGFVDAAQEAYDGMLSAVPRPRRETAVMIDIGGSNTKMACMPDRLLRTAELAYGSVTLREAAANQGPDYLTGLTAALRTMISPGFAEQSKKTDCIANRQRIYWLGGAAWATATFMHPDQALRGYVNLSAADLDSFLTQLRNDTWLQHAPALRFAPDVKPDQREKIKAAHESDWKRVPETFSREDLLAGVSLMKAIVGAQQRAPAIVFVRHGSYIVGYALERFRADVGGEAEPEPSYFAGIDLGSKGIKAYVYSFVNEQDGPDARTVFKDEVNTKLVNSAKDNRFTPEGVEEATAAVARLYGEMKDFADKNRIKPQYYIVASSGVSALDNRDVLKAAVERAVPVTVEFIDVKAEGAYGLYSAVPVDREQDALHVDIGSANTKIGCLIRETYNSAEIPFGSVTLRKAVPAANYATTLRGFVVSDVAHKYDELRMNTPCLESRNMIYFSGGAAWATATFVHPEAALWGYVPLTRAEVENFARQLEDGSWNRTPPQLRFGPRITVTQRAEIQRKLDGDRKKVLDTFSREDLMAGVAIMRTILDKGNRSARVWFVRNGNYLFGYALKKYKDSIRFASATLASSTP